LPPAILVFMMGSLNMPLAEDWEVREERNQFLIFSIQQYTGILLLQPHGWPSDCEEVKTMTGLQVTYSETGRS